MATWTPESEIPEEGWIVAWCTGGEPKHPWTVGPIRLTPETRRLFDLWAEGALEVNGGYVHYVVVPPDIEDGDLSELAALAG